MKAARVLDIALLRSTFEYDAETGVITRREDGSAAFASRHKSGYAWGSFKNKQFLGHRIAWAIFYGTDAETIDHINGNKTDNRINNLRSVTMRENSKNAAIFKTNTSGFRGVHWNSYWKRWKVGVVVNYKYIHVGTYKCIGAAAIAYHIAAMENGFHRNHGRTAN